MPELKPIPKFRVGDLVRVKHGVTDIDYPDIPMGGWVGRISQIEGMCLVCWTEETLENVPLVYRKRCERDGIDIEEYWVAADDLEPAPIEPLNMEQPTAISTRPLSVDNQDDRICMAFGLTSDDPLPYDSKATELTYFNYLKTNLTFPFPARFTDHAKGRKREVAVTGMCDDFPLDEGFGVMCEVWTEVRRGRCLCRNWKSSRVIPTTRWWTISSLGSSTPPRRTWMAISTATGMRTRTRLGRTRKMTSVMSLNRTPRKNRHLLGRRSVQLSVPLWQWEEVQEMLLEEAER